VSSRAALQTCSLESILLKNLCTQGSRRAGKPDRALQARQRGAAVPGGKRPHAEEVEAGVATTGGGMDAAREVGHELSASSSRSALL